MSDRTALITGVITAAWITGIYVLAVTQSWGMQ